MYIYKYPFRTVSNRAGHWLHFLQSVEVKQVGKGTERFDRIRALFPVGYVGAVFVQVVSLLHPPPPPGLLYLSR